MILAILLDKLYYKLKTFFLQRAITKLMFKESRKEDNIGTNNSLPFSKDGGSKTITNS